MSCRNCGREHDCEPYFCESTANSFPPVIGIDPHVIELARQLDRPLVGPLNPLPRPQQNTPSTRNILHRRDDCWEVKYNHELLPSRDSVGMCHLAFILKNPATACSYHVMDSQVGRDPSGASWCPPVANAGMYSDVSSSMVIPQGLPVLDAEAKADYSRALTELEEYKHAARERGDIDRVEEIIDRQTELERQLCSGVGFGGRLRTVGGDDKKLRDRVRKAIERAIQAFERKDTRLGTTLGIHLRSCIHLDGDSAMYLPTPLDKPWDVNF